MVPVKPISSIGRLFMRPTSIMPTLTPTTLTMPMLIDAVTDALATKPVLCRMVGP